jgi:glycosyltransferase involved in cell wall biosynthesis
MHIGFDVSQTGSGKAGCGYFAHAMIEAMIDVAPTNSYQLFPSFGDFYFDPLMPIGNPYAGQTATYYGPRHLSRESAQRFWLGGDSRETLDGLDIVHANNFWCPVAPTSSRLIYTFYDMGFAVNPEWTTEANRRGCFDGVFRSAVAADWVVAISEASRDHYLRTFPFFPADRIRVIHPCSRFADPDAPGQRPTSLDGIAAGGFWLNVGTIEPRKNQHRLAEAYARYRLSSPDPLPLVLAGGKGWLMEDFQAHLLALGITEHVLLTGYVSDDELIWLYRNCYANLYPSLFEGFGLPVLEGMQFGAPTIASDNTSIPEVAGSAAILLPADDVDAWTRALLHLQAHGDERNRLADAARARARTFDWTSSAKSLLDLYTSAMALPKRILPR